MIDISKMGERIDINNAANLIAYSLGKDKPVHRKTVYNWINKGAFPKQIKTPNGAAVWNKKECMEMLGLSQ
ncbi:TPA: helix-turn-helix transcriptional regulator [Neisseria weaveri]